MCVYSCDTVLVTSGPDTACGSSVDTVSFVTGHPSKPSAMRRKFRNDIVTLGLNEVPLQPERSSGVERSCI